MFSSTCIQLSSFSCTAVHNSSLARKTSRLKMCRHESRPTPSPTGTASHGVVGTDQGPRFNVGT
eukprot:7382193-Prymnesium_polylepis.1